MTFIHIIGSFSVKKFRYSLNDLCITCIQKSDYYYKDSFFLLFFRLTLNKFIFWTFKQIPLQDRGNMSDGRRVDCEKGQCGNVQSEEKSKHNTRVCCEGQAQNPNLLCVSKSTRDRATSTESLTCTIDLGMESDEDVPQCSNWIKDLNTVRSGEKKDKTKVMNQWGH